jgi:4-amino-4-deoxy-L-arabinose transferase-like glycosyltransferase
VGRRRFALLLAAVLVCSFALHARQATHPTTGYQSADERAYGRLAIGLAEDGTYDDPRRHWPPGAPVLFAAAHAVAGEPGSRETADIPAAYWVQAGASTISALLAALLALVLAGPVAGLLAGALVGFYPPLILQTGEQLSEPTGAMWLTGAVLALALAARGGERWWAYAPAGVLLGAAVLTRADLLPAAVLLPLLVALWHRRPGPGLALAAGAAVAILPWTAYASSEAGKLVPVTQGSASALFVGTYLPGGGTTVGMKRDLQEAVWRRNPRLAGTPGYEIPAREVLEVVADRRPGLSYEDALAAEGRRNLVRYGLERPLAFGQMMVDKGIQRMWSRYARGGARHTSPWIRGWHVLLVIGAFSGLACGLRARRDLTLAAIVALVLTSTAVHAVMVSQARYNLPLMPVVLAGGVAGLAIVRARLARPAPVAGDRAPGAVPAGAAAPR